MELKSFARRDSATAMLRKAGADKSQYNDYIKVNGSFFDVWMRNGIPLTQAEAVAQKILETGTKKVVKAVAESAKKADAKIASDGMEGHETRTVSSACRQLVKAGKTNAEIWEIVKKEFKLTDNKKHYPAWYRAEVARKGG